MCTNLKSLGESRWILVSLIWRIFVRMDSRILIEFRTLVQCIGPTQEVVIIALKCYKQFMEKV